LPVLCQCFASALPVLCQCFASALPVLCWARRCPAPPRMVSVPTPPAAVQCAVLALAALIFSATSTASKLQGAYYDDPGYDMSHDLGLASFPAPNRPLTPQSQWRAERRLHRPDSDFYRHRSDFGRQGDGFAPPSYRSGPVLAELGSTAAPPSIPYGYNADPNLRAVAGRSLPPSAAQNGPMVNQFYRFAQLDQRRPASAPQRVSADDPFGGDVSNAPTQYLSTSRRRAFEAPAFNEVMSQIKEIVSHPQTNPTPNHLHHIIANVVEPPAVAPPPAPPPIPTGMNSGPPVPAFIQTTSIPVHSATSGAEPLRVVSPDDASAGPSFIAMQSSTHPSTGHRAEPEAEKMRFRLEASPEPGQHPPVTPQQKPRDPSGMPFLDSPVPSVSKARAFIEEVAGVRKHLEVPHRAPIVMPPPAVHAAEPHKAIDSFRVWE